jgi:hypothetical protein
MSFFINVFNLSMLTFTIANESLDAFIIQNCTDVRPVKILSPEGQVWLPLHPDPTALVGLLHPAQALVGALQAFGPSLIPVEEILLFIQIGIFGC